MGAKIFWALLFLAVYLGLMLSGHDLYLKNGLEKAYHYVSFLLEDLEVYR